MSKKAVGRFMGVSEASFHYSIVPLFLPILSANEYNQTHDDE
jgi:hypothetical protein